MLKETYKIAFSAYPINSVTITFDLLTQSLIRLSLSQTNLCVLHRFSELFYKVGNQTNASMTFCAQNFSTILYVHCIIYMLSTLSIRSVEDDLPNILVIQKFVKAT